MTIGYFALFALYFVAVASDSSDGKCKLRPTDDERTIAYSCVHVQFDAIDGIDSAAERIEFTVSKLVHLPSRAFARFHLRELSFYDCDIREIDPDAFDGLPNLKLLKFYQSHIEILKASWFSGLRGLTSLALPRNNLLYIDPGVFAFLPFLEHLELEDNDLNCLPPRALAPLRRLKDLRIRKNPWLCSCYDDLVDWMKYRGIRDESRNDTSLRECMIDWYAPVTNTNATYRMLSNYSSSQGESYVSFSSNGDARCVGRTISALYEIPDDAKSITFSNSQISSIPDFAFFKFGNTLRSLEFDGSNVREIKPDAFAGLAKLERLVVFNNSLETVKSDWIREIQGLRLLSLEGNGITSIEPSVYLYLQNLVVLNLNNNKLKCLPIDKLALLSNLKKVQITNNPWNYSCRNELTQWLIDHQIAYDINYGGYRNGEIQTLSGDYNRVQSTFQNVSREQWSSYRNASFQTHTETSFSDNSTVYHYMPLTVKTQNNQVAQASSKEATHIERQQELRLREHERENRTQATVLIIPEHEQESRNQREPSRPCWRINDNIPPSPNSIRPSRNCTVRMIRPNNRYPAACIIIVSWYNTHGSQYTCTNRSALDLQRIPWHATEVTVRYSLIPELPNEAFRKFADTLVYLELSYCGIRNIDVYAFDGLVNLRHLNLTGNHITVVRAEWFQYTYNLEILVLSQNSIDRIEPDVFQKLPKLYELQLRENQLNCFNINELCKLNRLARIDIRQNPWRCLCLPKVMEILDKCGIKYHKEHLVKHHYCVNRPPIASTPAPPEITTEQKIGTKPPVPTMAIPSTMPPDISVTPLPPAQKRCVVDRGTCTCNGANLWDLNDVQNNVEVIEFHNSTIWHVQADAFRRFTNLKKLVFYNCNIHKIDENAFRGLHGLEWLIIENARIATVRSSWFRDLGALTHLVLRNDSIVEIETEVFQYTRNLRLLSLEHNNLECIYTNSLLPLTKLERMEIGKNNLKWRCKNELIQFLTARNCTYTISTSNSQCNICTPANYTNVTTIQNGATDESISTVNVLVASLTMIILTKF